MSSEERPYALVAELTYRCPLRCPYCSNPTDFAEHPDRLTAADWTRVLTQAEELGVLQVNLTGGEPLLRDDLGTIVESAASADLYVNLITSGVPLERARLAELKEAGLHGVQVSIQDSHAEGSDKVAGRASFGEKLDVARWVKELALPLTLNFVLHRREHRPHHRDRCARGKRSAPTGSSSPTRSTSDSRSRTEPRSLPSRRSSTERGAAPPPRKSGSPAKWKSYSFWPDYYSDFPKACMSGWGRRYIVVSPDGLALPCHLAHNAARLPKESVLDGRSRPSGTGRVFRAFPRRPVMSEPCRSCERRTIDFGGCRCQAFHLTGDAAALTRRARCRPATPISRGRAKRRSSIGSLVPLRFQLQVEPPSRGQNDSRPGDVRSGDQPLGVR